MTLDADELRQTAMDHRENLRRSGLSESQVEADLGWSAERLRTALDPLGAQNPVDSWELRDYLLQALADGRGEAQPYAILTDANRRRALQWFPLRTAPSASPRR